MSITSNITALKEELPETVTLVAVTKTKPVTAILEAYDVGHRVFGESKIQEMTQKWESLPKDIKWHMIGHVQRNKVKYMAEYVSLIHGVDSLKLLREINKQAQKYGRTIRCLLQLHIAEESTKFGMDKNELKLLLQSDEFKALTNVEIVGLMGMATFTSDADKVRKEFRYLKSVFDETKKEVQEMHILSMGMSSDYAMAIEEGSTMVRIGSRIFGAR